MRKSEITAIITVAVFYLILWLILPKPSFWGLDNGFKYQGAKNFAQTGSIGLSYDGANFDKNGSFKHIVHPFGYYEDGKQYPVFSPIFMVLSGLLMKLFGEFGPFLLPMIGGFGLMFVLLKLFRDLLPAENIGPAFILTAMGSPILFYSLELWEYTFALALVALGYRLLWKNLQMEQQIRNSVLAGICLGLAIGFRTEAVFLAVFPLLPFVRILQDLRSKGLFVVGFVVAVSTVGMINLWQTGTAIPLHLITNLEATADERWAFSITERLNNIHILFTQGARGAPLTSIVPLILISSLLYLLNKLRKMWVAIALILVSVSAWIWYLSIAVDQSVRSLYTLNSGGLFWIFPLSLLLLVPFNRPETKRFFHLCLWGIAFQAVMVLILFPVVRGVHWGPRYLMPALPLLIIAVVMQIHALWKSGKPERLVVVTLAVLSISMQLYSFDTLRTARVYNRDLNDWVAETNNFPSLTHIWWLPGDVSLHSVDHPWYITPYPVAFSAVIREMRSRKKKTVYYYERPPYIQSDLIEMNGMEPLGAEYFLKDDGRLRRVKFRVNP